MKNYVTIIMPLVILLMNSCISINTISVDIKEPAQISFSPEIVNIAIVDNSVLPKLPADESMKGNIINVDSAQMNLTKYLAKYIEGEKYFGQVIYYPNNRYGNTNISNTISENEVKNICTQTQTDALISIDDCQLTGSVTNNAYYDFGSTGIEIHVYVRMHIFKADGSPLAPVQKYSDTFYWNCYPSDFVSSKAPLIPAIDNALNIAVSNAADSITNMYVPYWTKRQLKYFSGFGSQDKIVNEYVGQNKWKEVIDIWEAINQKENKPLKKSKLSYNIATAYEFQDDIENALKWNTTAYEYAQRADNTYMTSDVDLQKENLLKRQSQLKKLKFQIGK